MNLDDDEGETGVIRNFKKSPTRGVGIGQMWRCYWNLIGMFMKFMVDLRAVCVDRPGE